MQNQLDTLLQEEVFKHFYEISKIPRESGNEKAVSDYIYDLMNTAGLVCHQDKLFNLIVKKNGQGKNATAKPLILQAHLDMVCVRSDQSNHNFLTDAINWKIDGDHILSGNKTSLGADCGIGAALIMEVLLSKTLSHPPIEAVFTTREETDMLGAYGIDETLLEAKRMINFDISPDNQLLAGSCGGVAIEFLLPIKQCISSNSQPRKSFLLSIEGMLGGHSGANINSGHGNAIVLLARALHYLEDYLPYELSAFDGGNSRLAIPTFAKSVITIAEKGTEKLVTAFEEFLASIQDELFSYSPEATFTLKESETISDTYIDFKSANKLISACLMLPTGIQEMNCTPQYTVESSCNLGVLQTNNDHALFICEIRSTYKSTQELLILKYQTIAHLLGATVQTHSKYSSWKYCSTSPVRDVIIKEYSELFHENINIIVSHSGNEIGIFYDKIKDLDAVAMGPTREHHHTTKEFLSIRSVRNFYTLLKNILSAL